MIFCITRFNWPHASWQGVPDGQYAQWVEQRLQLFEEYTLPSMRNCYVKPDCWVLLTSRDDLKVSERLESLCRGLPAKFIPYQGVPLREAFRRLLRTLEVPNRIITVRVDSDDLISSGFFARLKKDFGTHALGKKQVLSYPLGAIYVVQSRKFFVQAYKENPFIGLVEDIQGPDDVETVYFAQHVDVHSHVPIHHDFRCFQPMWASVIHDCNLANDSLLKSAAFSIAEEALIRQKFGLK